MESLETADPSFTAALLPPCLLPALNPKLVCSTGTSESLGRGCVQYMSAGTGVTHSEMNETDKL